MSNSDVRIEKLDPLLVATFWGFGPSPEIVAWEKLAAWARPRGYLDDPEQHPIYGFNNPDPSPGSPNYGYELWLVVEPGTEPAGDMRLHSFDGGLYAVMRCPVPQGNYEVIGATWKQLVAWREDSPYQYATHQWLEKSVLSPLWNIPMPAGVEFTLDLYLPITE